MIRVRNSIRLVLCDTQTEADAFAASENDLVIVPGVSVGGVMIGGAGFVPKRTYVIGENIGGETAIFDQTKSVTIDLSSYGFVKPPYVSLTPNDEGLVPPYKSLVTPTTVIIRTKLPWSGSIDVQIKERA